MAKSQGESPVRVAFPPLSLRGAEIARFTRNRLSNLRRIAKGKKQCLARAENTLPCFLALDGRGLW